VFIDLVQLICSCRINVGDIAMTFSLGGLGPQKGTSVVSKALVGRLFDLVGRFEKLLAGSALSFGLL